jgi:hypothetical protein
MAQITLNSTGVASNGTLALQSNGTTTAVTIDTSQNVGIGTISPVTKLQVNGSIAIPSSQNLSWGGAYGAGIPTLTADGTNGFQFYPNGSTSGEKIRIDTSGNVGIGTTSPTTKFVVSNAGAAGFEVDPTAISGATYSLFINRSTSAWIDDIRRASTYQWRDSAGNEKARIDSSGNLMLGKTGTSLNVVGIVNNPTGNITISNSASTTSADGIDIYSTGASAYRFYVAMNGTIYATSTTITAISDQRLKENIRDLDDGLDVVMALKPRKFDWKEGKGKDIKGDRGWIAQEFEQVFPDMIDTWKDKAPEGEEPYKSVRADLIPVLVKAIQEMKTIIDQQAERIAALEAK